MANFRENLSKLVETLWMKIEEAPKTTWTSLRTDWFILTADFWLDETAFPTFEKVDSRLWLDEKISVWVFSCDRFYPKISVSMIFFSPVKNDVSTLWLAISLFSLVNKTVSLARRSSWLINSTCLRVRFFKKIQDWILKSERIRKWILCFLTKQINPRSFGSRRVKGTEEYTLEVDSSVPLTHRDPRYLGLICLVKKCKIHFQILSDLRIQSWIFSSFKSD